MLMMACFLKVPIDLALLYRKLDIYTRASNAKVNYHKTEAFSISGSHAIYATTWHAPLLQHNIHQWHDRNSVDPIIYLGYPLATTVKQRDRFLSALTSKIETACKIHSQRSLSIRGRVTILNVLILSKLWHVLRVLSVLCLNH